MKRARARAHSPRWQILNIFSEDLEREKEMFRRAALAISAVRKESLDARGMKFNFFVRVFGIFSIF